jgi:prophage antirepressor-like protein
MSSIALSFNNVDLTPIDNGDNQLWFTSNQLAQALGYKNIRSLNKTYNSNSDEFTSKMTVTTLAVVDDINGSKRKVKVRLFSLRGCHLMGMLARTEIAKDFRKWVLNVLDDEVDKINAERDSLSFKYNQTCATAALVQRDLSQAGRDLRHLGQKVMPELLDKLAALESMIQPQLPNLEVVK